MGRAARHPPGLSVPHGRRPARALARRPPRLAAGDVDRGALQRQGALRGPTGGAPGVNAQTRARPGGHGGVEIGGRLGGRGLGALPRAAFCHRVGARRAHCRRQYAERHARSDAPGDQAPSQPRGDPPSAPRGRGARHCVRSGGDRSAGTRPNRSDFSSAWPPTWGHGAASWWRCVSTTSMGACSRSSEASRPMCSGPPRRVELGGSPLGVRRSSCGTRGRRPGPVGSPTAPPRPVAVLSWGRSPRPIDRGRPRPLVCVAVQSCPIRGLRVGTARAGCAIAVSEAGDARRRSNCVIASRRSATSKTRLRRPIVPCRSTPRSCK